MNPLEREAQSCTDWPAIPRELDTPKPAASASRRTVSVLTPGRTRTAISGDTTPPSRCGCA
jgi:hypothetical protein